jgi:regulator of extracellular matrix RemA (YlzA/DUF370 family)
MRFFPFVSLRVRMTVSVVLCLPDPYHGKSNAYILSNGVEKGVKCMANLRLINIGFGNAVSSNRVVAILTPGSSPMKRLKDEAKERGKLIDATQGRKTRSIIITDSDHVILSAIQAETITQRFSEGEE